MPKVEADVALWGSDPALAQWLADHAINAHPWSPESGRRDVILVGRSPAPGEAATWRELCRHIARGSSAVFLSPAVFKKGKDATGWAPLARKGTLAAQRWGHDWLYRHDHWNKRHPFFEGLPSGGLMDYTFYRNVISDTRWAGLDAPDELAAASVDTSFEYDAGVLLAVYKVGAGRVVLNTLDICGQLGQDPVAERLLRNLLRCAAAGAGQPPAELPAAFEAQLQALGY
jgi:hypothetical protein